MGIAGVIFVLVGGVDAALVWIPPAFGQPEWEFGSVTAGLNGLPLPVLGLLLVLGAALHAGNRKLARGIAVLMLLLAVLLLAAAALYLTVVPIALNAVNDAASSQGLKKSIVKTVTQLVCYPLGLAAASWQAWKLSRSNG